LLEHAKNEQKKQHTEKRLLMAWNTQVLQSTADPKTKRKLNNGLFQTRNKSNNYHDWQQQSQLRRN